MEKRELHNPNYMYNVSKAQLKIEVLNQTGVDGAQPLEAMSYPTTSSGMHNWKTVVKSDHFPQIEQHHHLDVE